MKCLHPHHYHIGGVFTKIDSSCILVEDPRPNRLARIMTELELDSMYSTCNRLKVSSQALDSNWRPIAMGRNGSPIGMRHCFEQEKTAERCTKCIHSEKNVINIAASLGVKLEGANLVTLYRPCVSCANDIVQVGFGGLYYRSDYDSDGQKDYVLDMLRNSGIHVERVELSEKEFTFSALLKEWVQTWDSGSNPAQ